MAATTVAVDVAKSVFELAIANAQWRVTLDGEFAAVAREQEISDVH